MIAEVATEFPLVQSDDEAANASVAASRETIMAGLRMAGRSAIPSCDIVTIDRHYPPDPPSGGIKIDKHSQVTFNLVANPVSDAKIAFLIKAHQDVESLQIIKPSINVVRDDTVGTEADRVFGSNSGEDHWVGFKATYPGTPWPACLETRFILRPFHGNPMHIQLVSVMFTFSHFASHYLHGISTCVGSGINFQIETRSFFIP